MSVGERDPYTGHMTTGHEWNGIKELNTPVPRLVFYFLALAFAGSLIYWVLMPAFPLGFTYTKGLLGIDQHKLVAQSVAEGQAQRAVWLDRIQSEDVDTILADTQLMTNVRLAGHRLFGDNCAACHGRNATGGPGFPNLVQAPFLWGGDPDTLLETLRVGINSNHPDTRVSQMLAFGRDHMLEGPDINDVALYAKSLSDPTAVAGADPAALEHGAQVFADNCASCHGPDGKGLAESGAPNLTDSFWLYGASIDTIKQTLQNGRQGHMPSWEARLTPAERKLLVVYLLDLRQQNQKRQTGSS